MFQQTTCFGLSLALHLAVAGSLILAASRNVERTPKAIMVILDNFATTDQPRLAPVAAVARPVALPARQGVAHPEIQQQAHQATAPQIPAPVPAYALSQTRELPKTASEVPPATISRPVTESGLPAQVPHAKPPVRQAATPQEERSTPEKAQQRYLKEHFAYIRDLITRKLSYPPMARKMRWTGKTVVTFVVDENGAVHNIRVLESSGFTILDKSAIETVRNVAPFPKPPVRAEIVVPISFTMM